MKCTYTEGVTVTGRKTSFRSTSQARPLLAAAGVLVVCRCAFAESPPPTTTAPSRLKPGVLHIDRADVYLGFESDYERRRVTYRGSDRFRSRYEERDFELRELLGMQLMGDVVDPGLLDWRADLEFGLTQDRWEEKIGSYHDVDWDTGFLQNYDVSVDAFKAKPISVHGYARRGDDRISRRFLPSLREERDEAGVSALGVYGPVTTEIGYSHLDVDRTNNRLDEDNENLQTSRFYADTKWDISDGHVLKLNFDHERQESTYQGSDFDFDTSRNELRLDHELAFGDGKKHRLDTYFRYNEEHGDLARDELELVPRLTLQHTDKLRTVHRYGMYRWEQDALEVNQHKFDSDILYQATKHLRLSLEGYGLFERTDDDTDTHEFGGGLDVSYDRRTPYGEFSANADFEYDYSRTQGSDGRRFVLDEAHTFHGVRPMYLSKRGVLPLTVLAHDGKRTRVYAQGLDYTVTMIDGRARLYRIPTGRIDEDEVVYFDYSYESPARQTTDTYRTGLSLEHAFNFGLTPYYYLETRCQEVDASTGYRWGADDMHRHRFGLRFQRDGWRVGGEYEIFDDTVEPYDAYHLTGGLDLFRSAAHSLDLNGELSYYLFDGGVDDRNVWWLDLGLDDRMRINEHFSLISSLAYRWEDDSVDGKTHGVDVECGLRFQRGSLKVDLTVEYDLLSICDDREDGLGLYLKVRRDIPGLLSKSAR
ncbi:MAG: hypothetical protein JXQ73_13930 [Phycisphaerae bacterium]|nr:hypothetical protein [Phycisphaerae bacterium]